MTERKFFWCFISCFALSIYICDSRHSSVWISNNGYRDVMLSFPADITLEKRANIITSLKELIDFSSRVLYAATKRKAYFKSVTFLFPATWSSESAWLLDPNITLLQSNGGQENIVDANVVISDELSRQDPYTLQTDSCGQQGERIYVPTNFLLSKTPIKDKSIVFVHHWMRYRYGVFSEGGYEQDARYPAYYSVPGTTDVQVTSCINVPIDYNFTNSFEEPCVPKVNNATGKPESDECSCVLNTDLQTLRSSIMYHQALPHVFEFCDSDLSLDKSHNPNSPSKHNALCFEESPWFVILRNSDFFRGKNQATRFKPANMTYKYVRESHLRVVVAVDVSVNMKYQGRYILVKNAISKFILLDLPLGSEVGLVFFDENITSYTPQMKLLENEESKMNLLESGLIPDEPGSSNIFCVECATRTSLELLNDTVRNGLVVLITTNSAMNDADDLLEELTNEKIKVQLIAFSDDGLAGIHSNSPNLAFSTGGSVSHIPEVSPSAALLHLYMTFSQVLSHVLKYNVVLIKELSQEELDVKFSFEVDALSTKDLTLLLSGPTFSSIASPINEDETRLLSPNGDLVLMKKQYHIPAWMYYTDLSQTGTYTFKTRWKNPSTDILLAMVLAKPPNNKSGITVRTWINLQDGKVVGDMPVKLFAEVNYGIHPIANAKVVATVCSPTGHRISSFPLMDNGLGDPDITSNDGIYSRYFTNFTSEGYYNIIVEVSNGGNQTNIVYVSSSDCCGSYVPAEETEPLGMFTRVSGPVSFLVANLSGEDVYPPNRILNLQVTAIDVERRTYTLQWSAAGDDFDHGSAASYKVKLFSERTEAKRRFENSGLLLDYNRQIIRHTPATQYGEAQEYTVRLPDTLDTGRYYFAVKAVDAASNTGEVSNIVEVQFENSLRNWTVECDGESKGSGNNASRNTICNFEILGLVLVIFWPFSTTMFIKKVY